MQTGFPPIEINRRKLLIGAAAGGGLLVGWSLLPRRYPLPLAPGKDEFAFDAWLRIGKDGVVTVAVPQLEMGQGVSTILPQIVAMELGADWRQVAAQAAPVSEIWANAPLAARWAELWMPALSGAAASSESWLARKYAQSHRFMATADGTSLAAYEMPARIAAASARAMLAMAAARRWDVRFEECEASAGMIHHGKNHLTFGALVEEAMGFTPPNPPVLLPLPPAENPAAYPAGGALKFPRLDLPAKVDGSWQFAGDIRLPDMVHAAIRHAPMGEAAHLADYDPARARGISGFERLVKGKDWLAAVASDWWAAERALAAIAPRFAVHKPADSANVDQVLDKALKTGLAAHLVRQGDVDTALGDHPSLTARYDVAAATHATLETATATVRLRGDRVEIWLATQAPEAARAAVARALGVPIRNVILYPMAAGGSFDLRLEHNHAVEAALIAREVGKPVQLMWSRWQEQLAGIPRTPVAAVLSAKLGAEGEVLAWKARCALPATAREFGLRLFGGQTAAKARQMGGDHADPLALEGAVPPYAIPAFALEHVPVEIALPTGRMRGNAHGYTAFFTESFIDELAASLHREPLAFRMAMLGGDPRLAQCLQRVSALAGWNGGNDGSGQGIACHRIGRPDTGGCIAAVAIARRSETGVRVDRISAVADIGRIINADIARQQIEGGLIFGLGLALGASIPYARGLPLSGRLAHLGLPLLGTCPEIEVEFIASNADPADPGELGTAVAAPAIANALHSATGLRFRRLPLASED